jgi:hypothetical protein
MTRTFALACALLVAPVASCVPAPVNAGAPRSFVCTQVGMSLPENALAALAMSSPAPVLVADQAAFRCPCGQRRFGGATERLAGGGATEVIRTAGAREAVQTGGAVEQAKTGGAAEQTAAGGAVEREQKGGAVEKEKKGAAAEVSVLGGAKEAPRLGGAIEPLTCTEIDACVGFIVSGSGALRVRDARGWHSPGAGRCVED